MNAETLHQSFLGTLQADARIRNQAEQSLKEAQKTPGFLAACLDVIDSTAVELPIKKACLIYFKNTVIRNWKDGKGIDHDEKPIVRERLLPTIVHSDRSMKVIFIPILNDILVNDYPNEWPTFLQETTQLLSNTNDLDSLYTGMLCFSELCRKYRWMKNADRSTQLDPIIEQYFPILVQIGNEIIKDPNSSDNHWQLAEIVRLVMKCYKFVTYMDLPAPLRENKALSDWITLHIAIMNMNLPPSVMNTDEEDRSLNPWVKAQKWAYANIFNIYIRFGSQGWLASESYVEFRKLFSNSIVPELLKTYFGRIQEWRQGSRWISDACLYHIISFLEHGITRKSSWPLIEPCIGTIISEIAFPLLCPSDSTLSLFENDPQEYIMMTFSVEETTNSPVTAVRNMIATLTEKRKSVALQPILQFAYQKLTDLANSGNNINAAKEKEAALRLIAAISPQLTENGSIYKSQMEQFLAALVFPNFKSQFGFLRARTCDVSSKFDQIEFTDPQHLSTLFQGVIDCFNETNNLPIQFEAALAIQAFINFPQFKEALASIVVPTTEKLLTLSNAIDSDLIPAVIQSCVENYTEQLEPFGISLMGSLTEQLMRLLGELNDVQNADPEDFDSDELGSKTNAALGLFSTILTVLLYFENSADQISKLEQIYSPMIHFVLVNNLDSFFAESFEMIENTTFLTRMVSPVMWSLFEDSMNALMKSDLSLNLDDAMPALKNYMVYGSDMIKQNRGYQSAVTQIILKVFKMDGDFAADDVVTAAELATYYILALDSETAGPYIPHFVTSSLKLISDDDQDASSMYKMVLTNVVVASLVIDPNHCIKALIESNAVDPFFALWSESCSKYERVFDLKLSILGLLSFLSIDMNSLTSMKLSRFLPQVGINLAVLLTSTPSAISNLEKKRKKVATDDDKNVGNLELPEVGEGSDVEGEEGDQKEGAGNGESIIFDESYLAQYGFSTVEELEEDPYANTPLDNINIFKAFKDFMLATQSADSNKYNQIVSNLSQDQQTTMSNIIQIASD